MELSLFHKLLLWIARKTAGNIIGNSIEKAVDKLYKSLDTSKIYREVYDLAYEQTFPKEPEKSSNRNKVGIEYLDYMFKGNLSHKDLSPETLALHNKFQEILTKRYPFAMQYFEAHKNDLRGDRQEAKIDGISEAMGLVRVKMSVAFENGQTEEIIHPSFVRKHYEKELSLSPTETASCVTVQSATNSSNFMQSIEKLYAPMTRVVAQITPINGKRNNTFCPIMFKIANDGKHKIENIDLRFTFEDGVEIKRNNEELYLFTPQLKPNHPTYIDEEYNEVIIRGNELLPERQYTSDKVYVKMPYGMEITEIKWHLSSAHYTETGILVLKSYPYIAKDDIVHTTTLHEPVDEYVDNVEDIV